jgi:hypothetical protein
MLLSTENNILLDGSMEQSGEKLDGFSVACEGKLTFLVEASPKPKMNFSKQSVEKLTYNFNEKECKEVIDSLHDFPKTPFYKQFIKENNVYLPFYSSSSSEGKNEFFETDFIKNQNAKLSYELNPHRKVFIPSSDVSSTIQPNKSLNIINIFGGGIAEAKNDFLETKSRKNKIPHEKKCCLTFFTDTSQKSKRIFIEKIMKEETTNVEKLDGFSVACEGKINILDFHISAAKNELFSTKYKEIGLGTIFYGTMVTSPKDSLGKIKKQTFVIEDLFYYKGEPTIEKCFGEKWFLIHEFLQFFTFSSVFICENVNFTFAISKTKVLSSLPSQAIEKPSKNEFTETKFSFLAETLPDPKRNFSKQSVEKCKKMKKNKKPLEKTNVFYVMADLQYDIYYLYTENPTHLSKQNVNLPSPSQATEKPSNFTERSVEKLAYIPNIKTSIFMNNIFRKIRENKNIDFIEESDEEDNFENTAEDKFVDLKKIVIMECVFHNKFKKWVPVKVLEDNFLIRV